MKRSPLNAFQDALVALASAQPGKALEWWRHRNVLREFNGHCAFCGADLPSDGARHVAPLVPASHGGGNQGDNLVASCVACSAAKANLDWLDWRNAPTETEAQALDARRLATLSVSRNHHLRNPDLGKKKDTVLRHLGARWSHRRFTVFAALMDTDGFIGWERNAAPAADVIGVLLAHGGRRLRPCLWRLPPDRFHDAIWQLIDLNAWVRRIDLGEAHTDPTPDSSGDGQWHLTYTNVLDIRRRRPKLKPKWIPPEERPMDWGRRLLIEYEASWKTNRPFDWDWVNKHRETDLTFARNRDAKREANEKLLKELDATLELERQEAEARRAAKLPLIDRYWLELARRARDPNSGDAWADFLRKYGPAPTA